MLLDSKQADMLQRAVDEAFARLPKHLRTLKIRDEIAKIVVRAPGNHAEAARRYAQRVILRAASAKLTSKDVVTYEIVGGRMIPKPAG